MAATDKSLEASNLAEIWKAIFRPGAAEENQFANKYYTWHRPLSIQALLGQPRTWTSWSYRAAYPKLSALLEQASLENKLRCRVNFVELAIDDDRYDLRKLSYNEAHAPLSVIFDALKVIPTQTGSEDHSEVKLEGTALIKKLARILHITDISPLVLNCIFGTSSGLDISHIAAFVDRNLNGLNWAKVNLLQMRNAGWSSYIYEYHFSFYYVTFDYFEPDTVKPDPRKIRRSCPFGKRKSMKHRYIHEEAISFLLCGHFDDAFTCYQLGDTYFRPRYARDTGPRFFRTYDPSQSPGQLLLYWIAVALFHARSRWKNAIDALDAEIKAPSDVVFMEDRSDLMADDPQFSLSKTYFWALQTYKLFERTLEQTIATWETFKIDSLPKIQDGRISPENWDASVRSIDQAIELLKPKINRIKRGIQDVRDLREGLQSTAAVFDSRTAVRQGENIRLLTYITLLFLPLSFGTGIFSMQFVEPSSRTIKAFAITLPVITIVSALLIFNLNTLTVAFDSAVRKATFGLQRQMRLHHRNDWKDRALALYQDDISTESPVRKASKESSRWVYILFLFEVAMVVIPVSELNAALHFYGLFGSEQERERDGVDDDYSDKDDGSSHRPRKGRQKEVLMRVKRAAKQAEEEERKRKDEERGWAIALLRRSYRNIRHLGSALMHTIFTSARVLLLPIWVPILLVEYIFTVLAFTLLFNQHPSQANPSSAMPEEESLAAHSLSPFIRAWRTLGLNTLTLPTRHHHPHDNPPSPRLSDTFSHEPHLSNVRIKEQTPTETKLQSPQWSATTTATTKIQGTHNAPKHPGEHSPVVASPETLQEEEDISPVPFTDVEVSVFDPRRSRRTSGARMYRAAFSARHGDEAGRGAYRTNNEMG
ncbi:CorA-like Mg2+ transporter domain family protein [Histoplasma capsulatum G186AR]|uniref:CorA-like Mg2+ transporter domain family protein n=1 Tax=Ajellomyces capsulatus TaxID=5037 RepID=A0A8H8D809_AJECA|nr:CorA-like Mg2+ transporter domain family protein [Histoplasma capsulatum]QSS69801.1 CorA-like Mg2+ transporter domain family protein [Histoplasma capsulatum G186AR]